MIKFMFCPGTNPVSLVPPPVMMLPVELWILYQVEILL